MSAMRWSGAAFVALMAYVVGGGALLSAPTAAAVSGGITVGAILGIAWFFALWSALVAAMVFLIAWSGSGMAESEAAMAGGQIHSRPVKLRTSVGSRDRDLANAS